MIYHSPESHITPTFGASQERSFHAEKENIYFVGSTPLWSRVMGFQKNVLFSLQDITVRSLLIVNRLNYLNFAIFRFAQLRKLNLTKN